MFWGVCFKGMLHVFYWIFVLRWILVVLGLVFVVLSSGLFGGVR